MDYTKYFNIKTELDENSLGVAKKELNEKDSKQVAADIQYIREWIKKQDYMKSRTDDEFILAFLRTGKFSYSKTEQLIKNYWSGRTEMSEYFEDRNYDDDSVLMEIADMKLMFLLPQTDDFGRRVVVERFGRWNTTKHDQTDIGKYALSCLDLIVEDPRAQINGIVILMDLSGFNPSQATQITPARAQQFFKAMQDGYPMRFKALHYYNYPKIWDAVFAIIKLFLKEKMKDRIFFHGSDLSSIHKHIPKRILPEEYGGEEKSVATLNESWVNYIKLKGDELKAMESYGVDVEKKKKHGENKVLGANNFELSGTFKKISVD